MCGARGGIYYTEYKLTDCLCISVFSSRAGHDPVHGYSLQQSPRRVLLFRTVTINLKCQCLTAQSSSSYHIRFFRSDVQSVEVLDGSVGPDILPGGAYSISEKLHSMKVTYTTIMWWWGLHDREIISRIMQNMLIRNGQPKVIYDQNIFLSAYMLTSAECGCVLTCTGGKFMCVTGVCINEPADRKIRLGVYEHIRSIHMSLSSALCWRILMGITCMRTAWYTNTVCTQSAQV